MIERIHPSFIKHENLSIKSRGNPKYCFKSFDGKKEKLFLRSVIVDQFVNSYGH